MHRPSYRSHLFMGRLCVQAIGSIQSLCVVGCSISASALFRPVAIFALAFRPTNAGPPTTPCHSLSDIAKQLAGTMRSLIYMRRILYFRKLNPFYLHTKLFPRRSWIMRWQRFLFGSSQYGDKLMDVLELTVWVNRNGEAKKIIIVLCICHFRNPQQAVDSVIQVVEIMHIFWTTCNLEKVLLWLFAIIK